MISFCKISFGMPFGAETGEFDNAMADIWKHITTRMRSVVPWWKLFHTQGILILPFFLINFPESRKYEHALKQFRDKIKYFISEKRRTGVSEDDRDFLSMMLRAQESGEVQFTDKQIIDQVKKFFYCESPIVLHVSEWRNRYLGFYTHFYALFTCYQSRGGR